MHRVISIGWMLQGWSQIGEEKEPIMEMDELGEVLIGSPSQKAVLIGTYWHCIIHFLLLLVILFFLFFPLLTKNSWRTQTKALRFHFVCNIAMGFSIRAISLQHRRISAKSAASSLFGCSNWPQKKQLGWCGMIHFCNLWGILRERRQRRAWRCWVLCHLKGVLGRNWGGRRRRRHLWGGNCVGFRLWVKWGFCWRMRLLCI